MSTRIHNLQPVLWILNAGNLLLGGLPSGINGNAYAIGGPTLSMWVESWNQMRNNTLKYGEVTENGYALWSCSEPYYQARRSYNYISSELKETILEDGSFTDDLYFPHFGWNQDYDGCSIYFLASPHADYDYNRCDENWAVYNHGFLEGRVGYGNDGGIRPVICLPSSIKLTEYKEENEFKYYNITNK